MDDDTYGTWGGRCTIQSDHLPSLLLAPPLPPPLALSPFSFFFFPFPSPLSPLPLSSLPILSYPIIRISTTISLSISNSLVSCLCSCSPVPSSYAYTYYLACYCNTLSPDLSVLLVVYYPSSSYNSNTSSLLTSLQHNHLC